jgi:DNA mismatch repair protein MutS
MCTLQVQRSHELIDLPPATRRNLELTQTLRGEDSPTLLSLLDTCRPAWAAACCATGCWSRRATARGHRALTPSRAALLAHGWRAAARCAALKGISDVERITARMALRQVRPRELAACATRWQSCPCARPAQGALLGSDAADAAAARGCAELLQRHRRRARGAGARRRRDRPGFDAELDELRAIQTNCDAFLLDLEARERARTGIANLRVQFNKVHGFYIEVTQGQVDKVPADYQRRQTLKNAERFITPELKAFEDKALSAQERALAREKWLYEQLLDAAAAAPAAAGRAGARAGRAGRAGALAERALTLGWCRAAVRAPALHRDRGRPPPGGRGAAGRDRRRPTSSPTTAG